MARQRKERYKFGKEYGRMVILKELYPVKYVLFYSWPSHYVLGTNSVCWKYDYIDEFDSYEDAELLKRILSDLQPTLF